MQWFRCSFENCSLHDVTLKRRPQNRKSMLYTKASYCVLSAGGNPIRRERAQPQKQKNQNSNMTPRLYGQNCKFFIDVQFLEETQAQTKQNQIWKNDRKPRGHDVILYFACDSRDL